MSDPDLGWLRDYQRRTVELIVKRQRGIIKIPTGGGKTEVMVGTFRSIPCRWLFVAPRMVLVRNAAVRWLRRELERLEAELGTVVTDGGDVEQATALACSIDDISTQLAALTAADGTKPLRADQVSWGHVGIVGDGIDTADLDHDRIIFASFATLHAQLEGRGGEIARWAQGLIVDESHQQPAETFYNVTMRCVNAFYRVGLSGTPLARGDKRNVLAIGALGRLLYEIKVKTLIDAGFFARPILRFVRYQVRDAPIEETCSICAGKGTYFDELTSIEAPCKKCKGRGVIKPQYAAIYSAAVVKSRARNELVIEIVKRARKPCMVFVEREIQGKALMKLAKRAKLDAVFVQGKTHDDPRREAEIKKVRRGEREIVFTTKIFREGVDIPNLASVVKASAGKSEISVLQELGRGARPDGENSSFEYWDIYDDGPEALRKQARARVKALEAEIGITVEIVDL